MNIPTIYVVQRRTGEYFARVETSTIGEPCTPPIVVTAYTELAGTVDIALALASFIISGGTGLAQAPVPR